METIINRIQILKRLDAWIGPYAMSLCRRQGGHRLPPKNTRRVLVIRPGGIGDAALLLPSLKAIKTTGYPIQIDVLCEKRNAGVFQATPYVDAIFCYDRPPHLLKLAGRRYDLIVDTEQSHFLSAVLSACLNGSYRIGFKVNGRQCIYDRALSYDHGRYEADSFWDLFHAVFPVPERFSWTPPYFFQNGKDGALEEKTDGTGGAVVCLFPGATIRQRRWNPLKWSRLVDHFEHRGYQVALLGGKAEVPTCDKIRRMSRTRQARNLAGHLTILETSWFLERAALLISTDSGILHVGALSGVPTVSLFGSGISLKWGPKGAQHRIVSLNLSCSPCTTFGTTPTCQHHIGCMRIPVDEVIAASETILQIDAGRSAGQSP